MFHHILKHPEEQIADLLPSKLKGRYRDECILINNNNYFFGVVSAAQTSNITLSTLYSMIIILCRDIMFSHFRLS